jgi:hypothetical protein
VGIHGTRRFNQVQKSAREGRPDKKLERKDCGKKEDNGDVSSIDPHKIEMMLRKRGSNLIYFAWNATVLSSEQ